MKKEKIRNRASVGIIILALVFTSILAYFPKEHQADGSSTLYASSVFDKTKIMNVNIIMDDDAWNDMLNNASAEEYCSCDIEINGRRYNNVGIRPKGNTSLRNIVQDDTTDRFSFKVEFDHYQKGQSLDGLDKLSLNNIMADSTYMKEYITYDILSYLGVNSSLFSYASIHRNGEYWGLYIAFEAIEDSFLQRTYGKSDGKLYKPESMGGSKGGEPGDMPDEMKKKLENMTEEERKAYMDKMMQGGDQGQQAPPDMQGGNQGQQVPPDMQNGGPGRGPGGGMGSDLAYKDDNYDSYDVIWESSILGDATDADKDRVITALKNISNKENVEEYLDVDQMLRYIAANVFVANDDSYFGNMLHNYYLYEENGKLCMLPWDYNLAFGGMAMGANGDATQVVNRGIDDVISSGTLEDRPFLAAVLSTDEYMEQYYQYLKELMDGYFASGVFEANVSKIKKLITPYIKSDPTAFYTFDEFEKGYDTLMKFIDARVESIQKQLDGEIPAKVAERTDKDTLVDGSDITLNDMGTMFGGKGGPGEENKGGDQPAFENKDNGGNQSPSGKKEDSKKQDSSNKEENQQGRPDEQGGPGDPGAMMPEFEKANEADKSNEKNAWILTGVSIAVMFTALVFIKYFRRRKYRSN